MNFRGNGKKLCLFLELGVKICNRLKNSYAFSSPNAQKYETGEGIEWKRNGMEWNGGSDRGEKLKITD